MKNLNHRVLRGLQRRVAELDVVVVQRSGLAGADDQHVLQWAADTGRVVITHDVSTMIYFAYERLRDGQTMPGLLVIKSDGSIGQAVDWLCVWAELGEPADCANQVIYLPT